VDSLSASAAAAGLMDPYWLGMGAMVGLGVVLVCEEPRGRFWPCCGGCVVAGGGAAVSFTIALSAAPCRPHVRPSFLPAYLFTLNDAFSHLE
jgi:hypothetical protein